MAVLAEPQKKREITFDEFKKSVPIKIVVRDQKKTEEDILKIIHDKIQRALNGETVRMKLAGVNALKLRGYINENFEGVRARAWENEDGSWTVKVSPATVLDQKPSRIGIGAVESERKPPAGEQKPREKPAAPAQKPKAPSGPLALKDVEAAIAEDKKLDSLLRSARVSAEKAQKAVQQTKKFLEASQIPLSEFSPEAARKMIKGMYLTFCERDVDDATVISYAAELRKSKPAMQAITNSLIAERGNKTRFSPSDDIDPRTKKLAVSDEAIQLQVNAAFIAGVFNGTNQVFLLTLANYETQMEEVSRHHGKGPMQLTSASIFSDAGNKEILDDINAYFGEKSQLTKKIATLGYVSHNVISNYMAAAETLALKWSYIMTTSKPTGEERRIHKAVAQREKELGRPFRLSDIDSLPQNTSLLAYKRLAYHYNGNPAIQKTYERRVHKALDEGKYGDTVIGWLMDVRQNATTASLVPGRLHA